MSNFKILPIKGKNNSFRSADSRILSNIAPLAIIAIIFPNTRHTVFQAKAKSWYIFMIKKKFFFKKEAISSESKCVKLSSNLYIQIITRTNIFITTFNMRKNIYTCFTASCFRFPY